MTIKLMIESVANAIWSAHHISFAETTVFKSGTANTNHHNTANVVVNMAT